MSIIPMARYRAPRPDTAARPAETVRLYTALEAAGVLCVSDDYIYSRQKDGSLRVVDVGTNGRKKLRVRADDLQAFIDARTA